MSTSDYQVVACSLKKPASRPPVQICRITPLTRDKGQDEWGSSHQYYEGSRKECSKQGLFG